MCALIVAEGLFAFLIPSPKRDDRKLAAPPDGFAEQELFTFEIERCLHTVTSGHGDPVPRHTVWRSP
jgi:hypothetical protein